jgi:outer membrane protein
MLLKRTNLLFIAMLICIAPATGQTHVSLQELAARALEQNYRIQILKNRELMAGNENTYGNAGFLPTVSLRGDQLWGVQNTEQRFFNGDVRSGDNARNIRQDAMIELNWTVFDGFRMFAHRDRLGYLEQLSEIDTRYFVEQTLSDISDLYFQMVMEQQLLALLERTLEISDFRLRLESRKRDVGSGNALLYAQALIDFNADSTAVINKQRAIRELQLRINQITRAGTDFDFTPSQSAMELDGFDEFSRLVEKAVQNNSQLEISKLEELIAESNLKMERAARYPQVSVFGNYSYAGQSNEVGFIESSKAFGGQYGVRVRFNLYDGGRQNTRIKNSMLAQENSALSIQDVRSATESQLAILINAYDSYLLQYRLLEESLQAASQSLDIAREQLQAGAISGFEFRQAQIASFRVETQLSNLLFAMKSIETDIFRLTGDLIPNLF